MIGDYELLEELAQGGMGVVFRARQRSLNRVVALKMLLPGRVVSDVGRARFRAEAEATGELNHPNIVPIFEVGEHSGRPFFSMRLIEGGTLADLFRKSPRPPLRELIGTLAKVCRAVHYAHQRGILHRDLKPGNILIDSTGEPYVADFGLAKRLGEEGTTTTGAILGTPAYMAPEQASGKSVTTHTDVYALGAILYELLTGKPPFQSREIHLLLAQIRTDEPQPLAQLSPEVPRELELVCLKCLAKEASQRYASADEVGDELERWLRGEAVHVRAPGVISRIQLWARHNSRATFWVIVIGVVWGMFGPQWPLSRKSAFSLEQHFSVGSFFPEVSEGWGGLASWPFPAGSFALAMAIAGVLHLAVGMATYLATQSQSRAFQSRSAVAVAFLGGVIAFILHIAPTMLVRTAVQPTMGDLDLLARGFATREADPRDSVPVDPDQVRWRPAIRTEEESLAHRKLLEQYPKLADAHEHDRGWLLLQKTRTVTMQGIHKGLTLGIILTLIYSSLVAVGGTLIAGYLVRLWGSPRAALLPYLEACVSLSLGCYATIVLVDLLLRGYGLIGTFHLVILTLLSPVPLYAVLRGWDTQTRLQLYQVLMGCVLVLFGILFAILAEVVVRLKLVTIANIDLLNPALATMVNLFTGLLLAGLGLLVCVVNIRAWRHQQKFQADGKSTVHGQAVTGMWGESVRPPSQNESTQPHQDRDP
ncbi:MAG: serine/threonine protein kinase [Planctomycetes bacterium]|nr:serine/threonine protein kinase [Planctomycetota bacterium]